MSESQNFYGLLCFGDKPITKHLPDIHINLWETEKWAFMDIGLMMSSLSELEKITFLLPWEKEDKDHVLDLLKEGVIKSPSAINAVFNEAWSVNLSQTGEVLVIDDTNTTRFAIVPVGNYIEKVNNPILQNKSHGLTLNIKSLVEKEVATLKDKCTNYYVRFRILEIPKSFYSMGLSQKDSMILSSWTATDILDFRLNVRRGVPANLVKQFGNLLSFEKVHLFLMRSREYDISFQDATFRACRSLENEVFWKEYSSKGLSEIDQQRQGATIKESLGYQWSKRASNNIAVDEFSVLARFKKTKHGLKSFLIIALLLGALGNGSWEALKLVYSKIVCSAISSPAELAKTSFWRLPCAW